jgi:Spy/CpxP family protein refolding chaperone
MTAARARVLAASVLSLAVLAGVFGGVLLDRTVLLPRAFGGMRRGARPPGMQKAVLSRLTSELALTPDQRARVDTLMRHNERVFDAARATIQPRMDSIITAARVGMDSILTPEQREKLEALRNRNAFGPPLPPWSGGAMNPPPV